MLLIVLMWITFNFDVSSFDTPDLVFAVLVATNASQSGTTKSSLRVHGVRVCMIHRRGVVRAIVHSCVTVRYVCRAVHGQARVLIKGGYWEPNTQPHCW